MESYEENPTPPGGGRMAVALPGALSTEIPTPPGTPVPPELRAIVADETGQEDPRTPAADAGSTASDPGSTDSDPGSTDSGTDRNGGSGDRPDTASAPNADTHTEIPGTDGAVRAEEQPA